MPLSYVVFAGLVAVSAMVGCSSKRDAIALAEKTDAEKPSIAEVKALAEEGFIYGLPIVMNAVLYDSQTPEPIQPE